MNISEDGNDVQIKCGHYFSDALFALNNSHKRRQDYEKSEKNSEKNLQNIFPN